MQDHAIDKSNFLQGILMSSNHPITFYSELSDDRLRVIATKLLDMRYSTFREMSSPFDDNYTRETAVFGRSKNMLVEMALSGEHDWMFLGHAGMDVTFKIGQVPCRFFRDDPDSPEKAGFLKRNAVDDLFAIDEHHPVMWRFVVEKALTDDDEDRVFFVGYNVYQEKVSEWMYQASLPMLHAVDQGVPAAAEIPAASVDVREDRSAQLDGDLKTGSDE
jgi:hypothetical protein